jgi:phenylacetate-CoA ligase
VIPEIETKSREEIKAFQEGKLGELLKYLSEKSPYYSEMFSQSKIDINSINNLEDLLRIPVTTKDDLQKHTKDFICVDTQKIIDYNTTSGTLGDPVTFVLTDKDIDRLAYNEFISLSCSNGSIDDIYQLMVTIDRRFMAGIAYYLGIRKMGAGMVRVGPGNPQLQFDTINRINPTTFITVPSFLIKLIDYAEKAGIDYNSTSVKQAVCIGEPIRNSDFSLNTLGRRIKEKWDLELYSTYASTEMGTAFNECEFGCGGHHHPEMIIVEFLDENNMPVPENEQGEVVITTLGVEAMPLLRFKTGDICYHYTETCKCGRTTMRLGPVLGRKKQMIKYKGTTLYPSIIYDILNEIDFIENYFIEVFTGNLGTDEILIRVGCETREKTFEKIIKDNFRAKMRVAPDIQLVSPNEVNKLQLTGMNRKPYIFADNRKSI